MRTFTLPRILSNVFRLFSRIGTPSVVALFVFAALSLSETPRAKAQCFGGTPAGTYPNGYRNANLNPAATGNWINQGSWGAGNYRAIYLETFTLSKPLGVALGLTRLLLCGDGITAHGML
jgi:hypothetical protein